MLQVSTAFDHQCLGLNYIKQNIDGYSPYEVFFN